MGTACRRKFPEKPHSTNPPGTPGRPIAWPLLSPLSRDLGGEFRIENLLQKNFCLGSFLADIERRLVLHALEKAGRNRSRAAEILGINRTTLIEKIKRFGLTQAESSSFSEVGGTRDSVGTASPVESET
ncbi:MAG: helix-turn-helix domain-containing protein [Nitrospirota bacterium]|nr:helix-turn-helix domain-containing protein [Nitrospirota bacterium]